MSQDTGIVFQALETELVDGWRRGQPDANGQPAERKISDGTGTPCRHCMEMIEAGAPYLVLAHRPFPDLQPYAETGPIFVHAEECPRGGGSSLPAFLASTHYIVRGYGADDRIVYGTGGVVETGRIGARASELLDMDTIRYVHVRSAQNNCYHCRVERD
jgi:hypothetical protein